MKKILYILLVLLAFPTTIYGASSEDRGTHQYFFPIVNFPYVPARMEMFTMTTPWGDDRTIRVYLPAGYDENFYSYPVLYFSDGQVYVGKVETDFIMVGIDSMWEPRWNELSPWKNNQMHLWWGMSPATRGGEGDNYLSFLLDVKSVVDNNYRTNPEREFTAIGGASMGGMFAIYAGLRRSDIFSKVLSFSPAVWFGSRDIDSWHTDNHFIDYIIDNQGTDVDMWIYVGEMEDHNHECYIQPCPSGDGLNYPEIYLFGAEKTSNILEGHLVVDPQGKHFVSDFLKHFDKAFNWLGW